MKQDLRSKLYLNVGCGANLFKNFINLDYQWRPGLDLCWDINKKISLKSGSMAGIFIEHCLEHFTYTAARDVLCDFLRILKPSGTVRIILPDAELYIDLYQRGKYGEDINFPYGVSARDITPDGKTPMMEVARVIGRDVGHYSAYDYLTLKTMLQQIGFVNIKKEIFRQGRDPMLLIDAEWRACESLYVEASSPFGCQR